MKPHAALRQTDELDGGNVLASFCLCIADLFTALTPPPQA
jgi:hypothetical protein